MRARDERGFSLIELTVVCALLVVVLVAITSWLMSYNRTGATAGARLSDDAAAKTALTLLESDIRFATALGIDSSKPELYVVLPSNTCVGWQVSSGNLVKSVSKTSSAVVVSGVSQVGTTPYFSTNAAYQGLVTVSFNIKLPQSATADPNGVQVAQTLAAANVSLVTSGEPTPGCSL